MSDQVKPFTTRNVIGKGTPGQPFSVTLNLSNTSDMAIMLHDTYGPIISESNDYRPLASYIRSLVSSSVQNAINIVQAQLVEIQRQSSRPLLPDDQPEESDWEELTDEEEDSL